MAPKKSKSKSKASAFPAMTTFGESDSKPPAPAPAPAPAPVAVATDNNGGSEKPPAKVAQVRKRKEARMDATAAKSAAAENVKTSADSKSAPANQTAAGSGGAKPAAAADSKSALAGNTKTKTSAGSGGSGGAATAATAATATTSTITNPHRKPVLTSADFEFFHKNGYVVIKQAISDDDAKAVVDDIWKYLAPLTPPGGKNFAKCYEPGSPCNVLGFIEMYHSQSMWNNRQNPRVYNAFVDLYQKEDLWVTIDRIGVKLPPPPADCKHKPGNDYRHTGFTHWDIDPTDSAVTAVCHDPTVPPFQLQGVIALEDTAVDMGGLHVYPGMHRYLSKWMSDRKVVIPQASVDSFYQRGFPVKVPKPEYALKGMEHVVVDMKRGDLAIWRGELAHGNGHNVSDRVRYAQYVTYFPQHFENESIRSLRVNAWKTRTHAGQCPLPQLAPNGQPPKQLMVGVAGRGDGREFEQKNVKTAELTELGMKLLGLEPW